MADINRLAAVAGIGPLDGMEYIRQRGEAGRQRGQTNYLSRLAGQAFTAAPAERPAIIGQMAQSDPQAALQAEQAFGKRDDSRIASVAQKARYIVGLAKNGQSQVAASMYPEFAQEARTLGLGEVPDQWDDSFVPGLEQLAQYGQQGIGGNVQSTYVDGAGNRVAIMRDGTTQVLGQNDAGANQQTLTIDIGGVPTQVTFDRRTGRYTNATLGGGAGAPPPAPAPQPTVQGAPVSIDPAIAPWLQERIRANPEAYAGGGNFELPPRDVSPQQYGTPLVGRTKEEEAAAVERARQQAQLDYLPETERVKRDSAIQQAVGIESGKNLAEKAAAAPAQIATLQASLDSIDQLLNSQELSSIVGLGSMNPLNQVPGTAARGLIARADQIAGQAFLAAFNQLKGGGAITEREGAAATAAMARLDRSQSLEDYRQALTDLKDAITPAIQRARQAAAGQAPASVQPAGWGIQRVD